MKMPQGSASMTGAVPWKVSPGQTRRTPPDWAVGISNPRRTFW